MPKATTVMRWILREIALQHLPVAAGLPAQASARKQQIEFKAIKSHLRSTDNGNMCCGACSCNDA